MAEDKKKKRKVYRDSSQGTSMVPDSKMSRKIVTNTKRGTNKTKLVETGTFRDAGTDNYQQQATKLKSKGKGGLGPAGAARGKQKMKYKTVKADGTVTKTTLKRKGEGAMMTSESSDKNVGKKRAARMMKRFGKKEARMREKTLKKKNK